MSDDPVVKVARDLTAIERMVGQLLTQAVHQGDHPLMPGGEAMVALGNVANLEAWENLTQASERYGRIYTSAEDEDPEESWPPFQLVEFWTEAWRRENGHEYGKRPTLLSEVSYLRAMLEWAWENEIGWDDMARDVNRARVKLEDILTEGTRVERSRIICDQCDDPQRLILAYTGTADDRSDDVWKCPGCKARYDVDGVKRAHAKMLRSAGAERWVHQTDAIGILKAQGRAEQLVRRWLAAGEGEGYCDPATHEVWVWWPSLWRKHLMTDTRERRNQSAV